MPYQYGNPANPRAHEETTGPEILADCPEIDVFVAGLGTGGTLMGVVALPAGARSRACASSPPSRCPASAVQGLRSLDEGFVPEILDPSLLDAKLLVSNRDAIAALRELVEREGIFAGPSSGAVLVVAARVARGDGARARSSPSCPTAAGSTSPRARTRATSTRWRPTSRAASTGGERRSAHPGPPSASLPAAIRDAIVAHARAGEPRTRRAA